MPIEITFTYTRDEYLRAMRGYYAKRIKMGRDVTAGLVGLAIGSWFWFARMRGGFAVAFIGISVLLLGMVAYARFFLPKFLYDSEPKLKSEYRLTFADDGILFRTDDIDLKIAWTMYQSWVCEPEFYLLFYGRRHLTVIPRRTLTSGDTDAQFAALVERKLGPAKT